MDIINTRTLTRTFIILLNFFNLIICQNFNYTSSLKLLKNCKLNVSGSFSATPPLFLDLNGNFIRAANSNGTIILQHGESVLLACSGYQNKFWTPRIHRKETIAKCVQGSKFQIDNSIYDIKSLECEKWPSPIQKSNGECLENHKSFEIGFNTSSTGFTSLIQLCHDTKNYRTFYSKFLLTKESVSFQAHVPRPIWLKGNLFGKLNIDKLYRRNSQIKTIGKLLGSPSLGKKYIQTSNDYFLARGHMTAKADFFYGTQQMATFYYANAAPQWQTFNGNNWEALERDVRQFASKIDEDLIVYTGTYGTDRLPNIYGELVPLSLDVSGKIPVPRKYWKIIYSRLQKKGTVFIGFNSPYLNVTEIPDELLCRDICHQIKWLTWEQHNIKKGYSYCCDVNDFVRKVKETPQLEIKGILK